MSDLNLEITQLKPAEIKAPYLSHFIGRAVLDLPRGLNLGHLSVKFNLPSPGAKSGKITFHENRNPEGDSQRPDLPALFRQIIEIKSLLGEAWAAGEYEINEFDRPARLAIHLTRNNILDDIRSDLELPPAPHKLEIELAIEQDWGFLEFSYEEIFNGSKAKLENQKEEARDRLINWVKNFLPHYHWQGTNMAPPQGSLATRYGFINPPDNRPAMLGDYYASFEMPKENEEKSTLDFLTFTVKTAETPQAEARPGNRKVDKRRGYESKKLSRLAQSPGRPPLPGKELVLYLEWQDLSEENPADLKAVYDTALHASVNRGELSDLSYYLGLWDFMLNSVRSLNEAGETYQRSTEAEKSETA